MAVGDPVTLCIRPEFIKVMEGETGEGDNIFRGRVESLLFVGDAYEGEIIIADTRLIIRIEPTAIVEEGDDITLSFDPDHCFVLSK
jgi:iron(III) transport system ATP-binding protein